MSADYELKAAVVSALKADPAVSGFVGARVYGRPSADAVTPYISIGPTTVVDDSSEGIPAQDITLQLDVWSAGTGEAYSDAEASKIAGAIRAALHDAELGLPTAGLVLLQHRITRIVRDPDGITHHGIVTLAATVED